MRQLIITTTACQLVCKGLNIEELIQNSRKITPAKKAKVTISEVFKGRLEGSVDLNFEAEGGNCAGGYYFEGETTLFFLSDVGEGLVRSAGPQINIFILQIRSENLIKPVQIQNY